jgi:hypothetical protein
MDSDDSDDDGDDYEDGTDDDDNDDLDLDDSSPMDGEDLVMANGDADYEPPGASIPGPASLPSLPQPPTYPEMETNQDFPKVARIRCNLTGLSQRYNVRNLFLFDMCLTGPVCCTNETSSCTSRPIKTRYTSTGPPAGFKSCPRPRALCCGREELTQLRSWAASSTVGLVIR